MTALDIGADACIFHDDEKRLGILEEMPAALLSHSTLTHLRCQQRQVTLRSPGETFITGTSGARGILRSAEIHSREALSGEALREAGYRVQGTEVSREALSREALREAHFGGVRGGLVSLIIRAPNDRLQQLILGDNNLASLPDELGMLHSLVLG